MTRSPANVTLPANPAPLAGAAGTHGGFDVMANAPDWATATAMLTAAGADAARAALAALEGAQDDDEAEDLNPRPSKRGKKSDSGTGADYAMRHQAAEQRRRARINERLDALRKLVPHDPRSNTASFLEDVIKHILMLKDTNEKLEAALLAAHPGAHTVAAAAAAAAIRNATSSLGRNGGTPPPPALPPPTHIPQLNAHSIQQLMAVPAGTSGPSGVRGPPGPPGVLPASLVGLAPTGNLGQLAQELDAGAVQVQQALLAMQQPGTTPEQAEAILRTFLSNASALQLIAPGTGGADDGSAAAGPARTSNNSSAGGFQQLLSAVSQLANTTLPDEAQVAVTLQTDPPAAVKGE